MAIGHLVYSLNMTTRDAQAICKDLKGDMDMDIYLSLLPILFLTYYAGRPGLRSIVISVVILIITDFLQRGSRMAGLTSASSLAERRGHPDYITVPQRWVWVENTLFASKVIQFVITLIIVTLTIR